MGTHLPIEVGMRLQIKRFPLIPMESFQGEWVSNSTILRCTGDKMKEELSFTKLIFCSCIIYYCLNIWRNIASFSLRRFSSISEVLVWPWTKLTFSSYWLCLSWDQLFPFLHLTMSCHLTSFSSVLLPLWSFPWLLRLSFIFPSP